MGSIKRSPPTFQLLEFLRGEANGEMDISLLYGPESAAPTETDSLYCLFNRPHPPLGLEGRWGRLILSLERPRLKDGRIGPVP